MKVNLKTFPKLVADPTTNEQTIMEWKEAFEAEQREQAIRLLRRRAGGRWRLFEAGMLYQILLLLGLKEELKSHAQVDELEKLVCSYNYEEMAEAKLKELLGEM